MARGAGVDADGTRPSFLDTPERLAALTSIATREVFRRYQTALEEHLDRRATWGREWVDASAHSDCYRLPLDAAGLKALNAELDAVIEALSHRAARCARARSRT